LFLNNKDNPQLNNTSVIIDFFERIIDGCAFELYFEEHMKERNITILEEVAKHLINIEDLTSLEEKRDAIYRSYAALKNSAVNEKLQLFAVRSPDILLPILRG
jgi:adenine-specific DNA-methyltransferase